MDPLGSPQLAGRSRYDPRLTNCHQFVDSNYYPRQSHHPASFPQPPPPPYQNQHPPRRHERDLRPAFDDGGRVYFPCPQPYPHDPFPQPSPRAPDCLPLPDDRYPLSRLHLPGHGEGFLQETRESRVFDADRFRVVDERQDLIRLRWEEEERRRLAASCRGNFYPEDLDDDLVERKRMRWAQDLDSDGNLGGPSRRHLQLWDGEVHYHHRGLPELLPGASLGVAYASSPRGTRNFVSPDGNREAASVTEWQQLPPPPPPPPLPPMSSYSDRDREDWREVGSVVEQHLHHSLPSIRPSGHSYSDGGREFLENNADVVYDMPSIHGSQENYFRGNRGKRKMSSGGNDYSVVRSPIKQPAKRPSALSRLQSGISVWNRIQEKPSFLSSPPPVPFSPSSNSGKDRAEVGTLDFSFKSNNLGGEVLSSPSPALLSSDGKDPEGLTPKKTVKKKKLVRKWEVVPVPVVSGSLVSEVKDGIPKKPIANTPEKVLNDPEVSGKQGTSSIKPANNTTPQTCSRRVTATVLMDKKIGKRTSNHIACGEDEDGHCNSAETLEIILANSTNSEHCQEEFTITKATDKSISEDPSVAVSLFEVGGFDDDKEKQLVKLGENDGQNCTSPVADVEAVNDASSRPADQGDLKASRNAGTEQLPSANFLAENTIAEDHGNQDGENFRCLDNSFVPSSCEYTSSLPPGRDEQFVMSVGHTSSTFSSDNGVDKNLKRKRQTDENLQLKVNMAAKELEEISYGKSTTGDAYLHLEMQSVSANVPPQLIDAESGEYLPDTAIDEKGDSLSSHARVESPQSDCLKPGEESLTVSSIFMSEIQDALHCTVSEQPHPVLPDSYGCTNINNDYDKHDQKLSTKDNSLSALRGPLVSEAEEGVKSDKDISCKPMIEKEKNILSHDFVKQKNLESKAINRQEHLGQKTFLSSGLPKVVPRRANLVSSLKESARSRHSVRNKTWHRKDAPSSSSQGVLQSQRGGSSCKQSPKKPGKLQSSYVRKGNSLIRKPSTEPPPKPSHTLGTSSKLSKDIMEKSMNFESKGGINDNLPCSNPSFERPKTPPLPLGTKLSNCTANPSLEVPHPLPENSVPEARTDVQSRPLDLASGGSNDQNVMIDNISEPLCTKRMIYVKHKSNQLVAASGPKSSDLANPSLEKTQALPSSASSDLYYRKKKNQLIRNIFSDGRKKQGMVHAENTSSDEQKASIFSSNDSSSTLLRKRLNKAQEKQYKHSGFSHVWTLNGKESHKKSVSSLTHLKVLPYLFPWKRTTYWTNNSSVLKRHSLLLCGRKLQLARKRNIVYTLSNYGFSLQKAGVSHVGRSSLKWSRSMQKRSKIFNKEATLAVAEVERKKRERKKLATVSHHENNGNSLLHEKSCATDQEAKNNSMVSSAPRKLLGGNNEYIRIGNGNQLVRDPKKLTRILASEKVRWSLHTARLRLARKRQYCQFFTRFGKCNKKGGKCPYIHDPTKVAICTKFLNGSCSDTNCKLTHKIIPERMPDCSYFLQGLCTNSSCPYRHVNVNPNASVCEGFLKGYCADGDKCHKKHSYVCPIFKATGKCLQGSKCKLHHPKIRNKCKERKGSMMQSNSWGRYFGSSISEVGEPLVVSLDKDDTEKVQELFCSDGRFADYISLSPDDDDVEASSMVSKEQSQFGSDNSDAQKDNLDALIKPIRIMRKDYLILPSADSSYSYNNQ